jgi:hypothetical protein
VVRWTLLVTTALYLIGCLALLPLDIKWTAPSRRLSLYAVDSLLIVSWIRDVPPDPNYLYTLCTDTRSGWRVEHNDVKMPIFWPPAVRRAMSRNNQSLGITLWFPALLMIAATWCAWRIHWCLEKRQRLRGLAVESAHE